MKNKILTILLLLAAVAPAWAYDFSAVAPSGQTLYYNIVDGNAEVTYPCHNSSSGIDDFYYGFSKPVGDIVIPSTVTYNGTTYSVTSIGVNAFYRCTGLTSVTIPSSVTSIEQRAFRGCTGLTSVTIPNSVTSIGQDAFWICTGLTSVTIPNSVTSIGGTAFSGCSGLTSIVVESGNTVYDSRNNCNAVIETASNTLLFGCMNTTIPNSVTSIGNEAFGGCTGLTFVTIPNSVTSIGSLAFGGCTGLTTVTISASVTSIGAYAFSMYLDDYDTIYNACTNLNTVNFNATNCTSMGSGVFSRCYSLSTINIGDNVQTIPNNAFSGCTGLTSITIPNSVTSIGEYAFKNCSGLTSVTIGNSVTYIGAGSFSGCTGLTGTLTIPNSVTTIDDDAYYIPGAFENCTGLTSITIGSSVTSIGNNTFSGCSGITEIHSLAYVAPTLGGSAFNGVTSTIPVYIPCGASASYYSRWSYFFNFIESEAFTFSAVSADNNMGTVQILTMPTCTSPQAVVYASANSGYRFDHWSDNNTTNPRTLTVTENTELLAYFAPDGSSNGIDDMTSTDNLKIYTRGNKIVIETTDAIKHSSNQSIIVYDVMGRIIHTNPSTQPPTTTIEIPVPTIGLYMVKVADHPSRKVLVRP